MTTISVSWVPSTIYAGNTATLVWNSIGTTGLTFSGTGVNVPPYPVGNNKATLGPAVAFNNGDQAFYFAFPGTYPAIYSTTELVPGQNLLSGYANLTVLPRPETTTIGTLTASNSTPIFNQPITITANVYPSNNGDVVNLLDNGDFIANASLIDGNATFTLTNLTVDTHVLQSYYAGNLSFAYGANTANVTVTVSTASNAILVLDSVQGYLANLDYNNTLVGLFTAANALAFAPPPSTYANSNVAAYLPTYTGNIASNVQFNTVGNVQATNLIASGFYFPNNQPFTSSVYSNANVASYMPVYAGNISATNVYVQSAGTTSNSITATVGNIAGNMIGRFGQFASMKMAVNNLGSPSGAITLDVGMSNVFGMSITGAITSITITNPPPSGVMTTIYIVITMNGSSSVTWPASFKWPSGTAPTLTTTTSKSDWISATTFDGGTSWLATVIGQNF